MTIPRAIERYYTRELFRLIQAELAKRDIVIETVEQLQGMMIGMIHMVQIGAITTMFLKEEKLCTYSKAVQVMGGIAFTFNGQVVDVEVPVWLLRLQPVLSAWDWVKAECRSIWFDLKYTLQK